MPERRVTRQSFVRGKAGIKRGPINDRAENFGRRCSLDSAIWYRDTSRYGEYLAIDCGSFWSLSIIGQFHYWLKDGRPSRHVLNSELVIPHDIWIYVHARNQLVVNSANIFEHRYVLTFIRARIGRTG